MVKTAFLDKKIRTGVLFICLLLFSLKSHATTCSYSYYLERHINFSHCQYHHRSSESLLQKARIKAVNDYIAHKIEIGELEDKKMEISMEDPLSIPYFIMINAPKAYYITIGGTTVDLELLLLIVDNFSSPAFKYFNLDSEKLYEQGIEDFHKELYKRLRRNAVPREKNLTEILAEKYVMWRKNALNITYKWENDDLRYIFYDEELPLQFAACPPSVIRDRYIIPTTIEKDNYYVDHIYVYQDSVLIKKFKLPEESDYYTEEFLEGRVYDKWVNFCRYDKCKYSYSYDANRFYFFDPPIERDK